MKITIELDAVSVSRLKLICAQWTHQHSDGIEIECEALLRAAISEKYWELNKCENDSKPVLSSGQRAT